MLLLGETPCWGLAKSRFPCISCPVSSYVPEGLSCHGTKPTAPSQLWPHSDSSSRGAFVSSLLAKIKPRVYSGMPYVMLEEIWLILLPDDFLSFPTCQIHLLLEAVTQEWRFCVADSVPVPLSGSDLEAHLIVNPSGMRPAFKLCLPLPCLRCQDTPSLLPWSCRLVLHLCLLSPPCAY
jgi:hypothetical protein